MEYVRNYLKENFPVVEIDIKDNMYKEYDVSEKYFEVQRRSSSTLTMSKMELGAQYKEFEQSMNPNLDSI